ncbi:hypothetical protein Tco_1264692 [Tanacetum coccineum]
MVEEHVKMKKKDQIRLDEEFAFKLQAKFDEQERIETKKADAEIAQESSSKREGYELEQEKEVAVDVIPLATKPPSIVNWKIHKEGKKSYYQIIRNDGSSKMYLVFSHMLKSFDKEYLETLYKLIKAKYGSTRPVEDLDLVLYGDLKTMFNPHVEDQVILYSASPPSPPYDFYDHHRSLPLQQPTTSIATFTASFNLCRSLQTLWKPSQQPTTYMETSVGASKLRCSLYASARAKKLCCSIHSSLQPIWKPPQEPPASLVAAFTTACNLCDILYKRQQAPLQPSWQLTTSMAAFTLT